MNIPEPKLIGYFARPTIGRPSCLKAPLVEEICCVGECSFWEWTHRNDDASGQLADWHDKGMMFPNSPAMAWSVIPEPLRAECDLYAYRMVPVQYVQGQQIPYAIREAHPVPMDASFSKLGYDLVSCENDWRLMHSPLCCASLADEVPTNQYCLLDTVAEAFALAPTLEVPGQPMRGEPGPYHIVEVWRQRRTPVSSSPE